MAGMGGVYIGNGGNFGPLDINWKEFEDAMKKLNEEIQAQQRGVYESAYQNKAARNAGADEQQALQQAAAENALSSQKQAEEAARTSASAGINKPRAGMLSDNAAQQSQTNNVPQLYGMAKNQTQTTSNDYLQKMAQADALDQQAKNIQAGAGLTAMGGAITGGASGAMTGATLGMGSDENMKESPDATNKERRTKESRSEVTDDELNKAIRQFRDLYKRVKALKGGK